MDEAHDDGRDESTAERADRNWGDILQELRATQAGTQIISGFLLAIAFQPVFPELETPERILYLCLVTLAGAATLLGILPILFHRRMFQQRHKDWVVRVGDRVLTILIATVALLATGVIGLIFGFTVGHLAGLIAMVVVAIVVTAVWVTLRSATRTVVGRRETRR